MTDFHIPQNARTLPNGRLEIAKNVEYGEDKSGRMRIFVGSAVFTIAEALKNKFVSPMKDNHATGGGFHNHPNSGVPRSRNGLA